MFPATLAAPNASGISTGKGKTEQKGKGKAPGVRGGFATEDQLAAPNNADEGVRSKQ